MILLGKPYTKKEVVEHADANGYLTGCIHIPFLDILTNGGVRCSN